MRKLLPALVLLLTAVTVACSGQGQPSPTSASVALASSTGSAAKPSHAANISLTTIINDVDSHGLSVDIASDGLGVYADSIGGVTSYLTSNGYNGIANGDWQFDTSNSPARGVNKSLDQDDAVQPGDPHFLVVANPPFWGTQTFKGKMQVECTFLGKNMLTMTAGASITCGLLNELTATSGVTYGLSPMHSFNGFPETTDVQIGCNSADAGGCKEWFIDPIGLGQAVARLNHRPTKNTQVTDGDFYLRFHIHLTRP